MADINDGGWVLVAEYTNLLSARELFKELVRHADRGEPRYIARLGLIVQIMNVTIVSNKLRLYSVYIQMGGGV